MQTNPIIDPLNEHISDSLEYTLSRLRDNLRASVNTDVVTRRVSIAGFSAALMYLDGMVNVEMLNFHVLDAAMKTIPYQGDVAGRIDWLTGTALTVSSLKTVEQMDQVVVSILTGDAALLVDGCGIAIMIDAKGFTKRSIEKPVNETVIIGPHEAFVENMKVNMTMLRRIIMSPRLVGEQVQVGTGIPTSCLIVYLDGVANEQILTELRRRLSNVNFDVLISSGELEQLIEDSPFSLLPQVVMTERPDRAASFLISGMAVVMLEGSPMVFGVPATLMHLLHTPDLNNMRFPYGAYKRLVILAGLLFTTLLPAMYVSIAQFHNDVLPLALMTSMYETESRIPIPLIYELIFLSFGFDLILEAASRMPGVLASGLGTVSALILGQAVVAADLVSPLVIVVVALSGLGTLMLPEYSMSVAMRLLQMVLLLAAAVGGVFGILLMLIFLGIEACSTTSLGVPLMWSYSPGRMHNPDNVERYPIWQQRIRSYLANPSQLLRARGPIRAWDRKGDQK